MLLRRETEHVKAQNWAAVAIDFVIVIVGVFIGIQASNWNDERQLRVEENRLFVQLEIELEEAIRSKQVWSDGIEKGWAELGAFVHVIQSEDAMQSVPQSQCNAAWASHIIDFGISNLAILGTIVSSGTTRSLKDDQLRKFLLELDALRNGHTEQYKFIREDFRNLIDRHPVAFPRTLISTPTLDYNDNGIPIESKVDCNLDFIKSDQEIQNQLVSNLARMTAVLQMGREEVAIMNALLTALKDKP